MSTPLRTPSGWGLTGPIPRDIAVLLGVSFATFSASHFSATAGLVELLRLSPLAWSSAQLWRLLTYPFAGIGAPSLWIMVEWLVLFLFARTVFYQLGRRSFWRLLVIASVAAGVAALVVDAVASGSSLNLILMQGQRMLLAIVIAGFATLNRSATILLFFVLPVKAAWFLGLEILFAFLSYLSSGDLAGFVGISMAVGATYWILDRGVPNLKVLWKRGEEQWLRQRMRRTAKRKGLRLVEPPENDEGNVRQGPWIN